MTARDITATAIRILAIWMALQVFLFSPAFLSLFVEMKESVSAFFQVALVLAYFAVGLLLAYVLFRASSSILRASSAVPSDGAVSEGFILQVAGAFFVVSAFEALAGIGLSIFVSVSINARDMMYFAVYSLEMIVGLAMVVKRDVFVNFFRVLRGRA